MSAAAGRARWAGLSCLVAGGLQQMASKEAAAGCGLTMACCACASNIGAWAEASTGRETRHPLITHPPASFQPAGMDASELRFESPTFDGLPVDWCTAPDQGCGQPAAQSFCAAQGYSGAADYAGPTPVPFGNQTVYPATGAVCDSGEMAGQCATFYYILCEV